MTCGTNLTYDVMLPHPTAQQLLVVESEMKFNVVYFRTKCCRTIRIASSAQRTTSCPKKNKNRLDIMYLLCCCCMKLAAGWCCSLWSVTYLVPGIYL